MEACFLAHAWKSAKEGENADRLMTQWGWGRPLQSPGGFERTLIPPALPIVTSKQIIALFRQHDKSVLTEMLKTTVLITSEQGISRTYFIFFLSLIFSRDNRILFMFFCTSPSPNLNNILSSEIGLS